MRNVEDRLRDVFHPRPVLAHREAHMAWGHRLHTGDISVIRSS